MPAHDYGFYLNAVESTASQPTVTPGGSGYFSTPRSDLDPKLFEGDTFRNDVRSWILNTLYDYWEQKFAKPRWWSTVWVAGSGISYQWAASRSNGDLDVLIGVDFVKFFKANPEYRGFEESEMADIINRDFHENLWPKTSNWRGYEVTFYVNPGGKDIRDINPYAAYDLTHDTWTVRPPSLPADPESLYPDEYRQAVSKERAQAQALVARHEELRNQAHAMAPNTPGWVNAVHGMGLVAQQARALFDAIHLGRKMAFAPGGSGYGDFYNYRWQSHKRAGTVQALAALSQIDRDARGAQATDLYGKPLESASEALSRAALWNSRAGVGR